MPSPGSRKDGQRQFLADRLFTSRAYGAARVERPLLELRGHPANDRVWGAKRSSQGEVTANA